MAIVANKLPKAKEPVSPIKILAGFLLKYKKPKQEALAAMEIIAKSILLFKKQITAQAKNATTDELAARPSKPSVKLTAFEAPTIIKATKTG